MPAVKKKWFKCFFYYSTLKRKNNKLIKYFSVFVSWKKKNPQQHLFHRHLTVHICKNFIAQ